MRLCFLLLVLPALLFADGKMYRVFEKGPAEIPYQLALIVHRDGLQTMVLQSKYELPPDAPPSALGWVIPLPSPPKVASMDPKFADALFLLSDMDSSPDVIKIFSFLNVLIGVWALWFICLLGTRDQTRRTRILHVGLILISVSLLAATALPAFASGPRGVEILSEHRAGVYDVTVVRADDAAPLLEWLAAHDFEFPDSDRAVFDAHIAAGGCFVAARLNPAGGTDASKIQHNGLAAPLVFQFPVEKPFYPLALTGTGGHKTEVLLYVYSDQPFSSGGRLPLRYSDSLRPRRNSFQALESFAVLLPDESGFQKEFIEGLTHFCKFKGVLRPDQMREDLVFTAAPDQPDFRETVIRW